MNKTRASRGSFALYAEGPALAVGSFHELIGVVVIGDLHIGRIPKQLFTTGEFFASSVFDEVAAQGEIPHEDGLRQRAGIFKRRAKLVLAVAGDAGVDPLSIMPSGSSGHAGDRLRDVEALH